MAEASTNRLILSASSSLFANLGDSGFELREHGQKLGLLFRRNMIADSTADLIFWMRSSVISQYDSCASSRQSPSGHRQRPFCLPFYKSSQLK